MDARASDNCVESKSAKMFSFIFAILFYGIPLGLAAFPGFPGLGGQFPGGQQSMFPFFNQGQGQQPNQNGGNNGIASPWSPFFPSNPFQQSGQQWPGFNNPTGSNPYQQQPVQGQGQQPPSATTPGQQYYNQGQGTPLAPAQPQQSQTPGSVQQGYGQPNPAVVPQQQQQPYQNSPYQSGYPGYGNNQNSPYYNQQNQNAPPQNGYLNTPQQQQQNQNQQPSPPNSNQWNPTPNQNQGQQVPQPPRQWDDGQYKPDGGYQPVNNNNGQQQPQQYNPSPPSPGWDSSGNQGQGQAPLVGDLRSNITPSYQSDPSQTQPQQQTTYNNNPSGTGGPAGWSYPDD